MIAAASASPSQPKIGIAASVRFAFTAVMDNAYLALALAWLPFVIVAAAQILGSLLGGDRWTVRISTALIDTTAWAVFIVRWHRFILLGETTAGRFFPPGWRTYVWTGVKLWLLLSLGLVVGFLLFTFVSVAAPFPSTGMVSIGLLVALVIGLGLAWLRVSLAFPAAAINRPISLVADAWDLLVGNYWRLVAAFILCCAPFAFVIYGLGAIVGALPSLLSDIVPVVDLAVLFAGAAVVASLLSEFYRRLSPPAPQSERRAF
jgi:hypothetical protein